MTIPAKTFDLEEKTMSVETSHRLLPEGRQIQVSMRPGTKREPVETFEFRCTKTFCLIWILSNESLLR